MNKKIITLVAVIMAVCMMFAACAQEQAPAPEHNHTFDSTKWASDATMHWHAANCEHTTEKTDIQGHIDENIDGVCDVCGYGTPVKKGIIAVPIVIMVMLILAAASITLLVMKQKRHRS